MALLAVGEKKGGKTQQKHSSASVGAGDTIIWLMMTLNGTILHADKARESVKERER